MEGRGSGEIEGGDPFYVLLMIPRFDGGREGEERTKVM